MNDELMAWARHHLRNRRPINTRHHVHHHPTRDGATTIEFDDYATGSYAGYLHTNRSHADISDCPTCRPLPTLNRT